MVSKNYSLYFFNDENYERPLNLTYKISYFRTDILFYIHRISATGCGGTTWGNPLVQEITFPSHLSKKFLYETDYSGGKKTRT